MVIHVPSNAASEPQQVAVEESNRSLRVNKGELWATPARSPYLVPKLEALAVHCGKEGCGNMVRRSRRLARFEAYEDVPSLEAPKLAFCLTSSGG